MVQHARKPANIREHNARLLLSCYLRGEACAPARLAPQLQMSRTAINRINEVLVEQGLIEPIGKGESTLIGGKRPLLFQLCSLFGYFFCVHVTYEVVSAQTLDFRLQPMRSVEIHVGHNPTLDRVLGAIKEAFQKLCRQES